MYPNNQMVPSGNAFMNQQPVQLTSNPVDYSNMRSIGANLQMMNQQPMQQAPMIQGRIIKDISEVQPNETPMDGSVRVFPTEDFTAIYAKTWDYNGNLLTYKFVPEIEVVDDEIEVGSTGYNAIMKRLDGIETLIKRNNYRGNRKNYNKKPKEENNAE